MKTAQKISRSEVRGILPPFKKIIYAL